MGSDGRLDLLANNFAKNPIRGDPAAPPGDCCCGGKAKGGAG